MRSVRSQRSGSGSDEYTYVSVFVFGDMGSDSVQSLAPISLPTNALQKTIMSEPKNKIIFLWL